MYVNFSSSFETYHAIKLHSKMFDFEYILLNFQIFTIDTKTFRVYNICNLILFQKKSGIQKDNNTTIEILKSQINRFLRIEIIK